MAKRKQVISEKVPEREFKFRVWDKEKKKMLIPPFKGPVGFCLIPTSPDWSATEYWDANKTVGFDCSVFDWADAGIMGQKIIQQFTGLKDKNNKDIFEGDVLCFERTLTKFKKGNSDLMVVEYHSQYANFGLTFKSIYGGEGCTGADQHFYYSVKNGAQVIGHRYQEKFSKWL